jgi:signal transduction histidine kinase
MRSRIAVIVAGLAALVVTATPVRAASQATSFQRQVDATRAAVVANPADGGRLADILNAAALKLPTAEERALGVATADWLRAEAAVRTNNPRAALGPLARALPQVDRFAPISKLHGDLLITQGAAAGALGNIQLTLQDYQRAYRIFGAAHNPRGQAIALLNLGSIYRDAGDYANALRYNADSAKAYDGEPALLGTAYTNRGNALMELNRSREAASEYQRALSQSRQLGSPLLEAQILQNLATSQIATGDLASAEATLQRGFALARSGPAASRVPALQGVAAQLALRRGKLNLAADLIKRSFAGIEQGRTSAPLLDFHRTAYEIFKRLGENAQALAHLEAFKQLEDDKKELAASTNAALMSAQFDFAKQNTTIAEGEAAKAWWQTIVVLGLLVAAAIISILLLIGFISIRRSRDQVRAANATLSTTNVALEKALTAKTEFLATTSHEIRTPLNGILGMTQVILADRALNTQMRSKIELVHGAGETMRALVDDILDVAKMETGELVIHAEDMDLIRLLGDAGQVWAGQAETKNITLAIEIGDAPGRIVADEVRLRQIVFNLMSNAIKFTDRGQVRLTAVASPEEDGERLIIRIEDSGIGIPSAHLENIFESFRQVDTGTTRRHGGTGLGLAICRSLAEAMGGTVRVESTVGLGSTFTLDLPLVRGQGSTIASDGAPREVERLADAEMLLVEGNPLSQGILRAVIGSAVRSLHIVGDLDAAYVALKGGIVHHVVADGGVLGLAIDAAAALATATHAANARLTLLWPAPDDATRTALTDAGADQIIAKPIAAPDLLAALQSGYSMQQNSQDIAA